MLFPNLDLENKVQINDMTRFHGRKSFVSKGSMAITTITIMPGADGAAISVFDADVDERFLDWEFDSFSIDIDATNNKLDFNEDGETELTATLVTATYTLAALMAEIKTQLDAAGANTYTVTLSDDNKMTITATSSFSLLPETGTNRLVSILPIVGIITKPGFDDTNFANKTEIEGVIIRELPRAVTIEIGDGVDTESKTFSIQVLSVEGDALLSVDADLKSHRSDIIDWLPDGRNTYKHVHRRAQNVILEFLDRNGNIDINGDKLTLDAFVNIDEFKEWSVFTALRVIHDELSNDPDDDFFTKAREFEHSEEVKRNRAILRIDIDKDGKADVGEGVGILGGSVRRR